MNKITKVMVASVKNNVESADSTARLIAGEIVNATQTNTSKIFRYIQRGVEEVASIISDISFELDNTLEPSKAEISKIATPEDGSAIITLKQELACSDIQKLPMLKEVVPNFTLRKEFAQYVGLKISPPANMSNVATATTTIRLPVDVVTEIVGGSATENWSKATKAIETYAKTLVKFL